MAEKQLLIEEPIPFDYQVRMEESEDSSRFLVSGVFQRADVENKNKRIYPSTLWNKVLKQESVVGRIQERNMVGELDHPADGQTQLHRVSHVITRLSYDPSRGDNAVLGEAEILDTPRGKILQELFRAKVKVGVSSRGNGTVRKNNRVAEDFELDTFDFVATPSTSGAFPEPGNLPEAAQPELDTILEALEKLEDLRERQHRETEDNTQLWAEASLLVNELGKSFSEKLQPLATEIKSQAELLKASCLKEEEKKSTSVTSAVSEVVWNRNDENHSSKNGFTESTIGSDGGADMQNQGDTLQTQLASLQQQLQEAQEVNRRLREKQRENEQAHVGELERKYEAAKKVIGDLEGRLRQVQEEHQDVESQLEAAEEVSRDLKQRLHQANEQVEEAQKNRVSETAVRGLQRRLEEQQQQFDASTQVAEAALRRAIAAEAVAETLAERLNESSLRQHIGEKLQGLSPEQAEKVRPILENCSSPEQVDSLWESVEQLVETRQQQARPAPSNLFPNQRRQLVEDAPTAAPLSQPGSLTEEAKSEKASVAVKAIEKMGWN